MEKRKHERKKVEPLEIVIEKIEYGNQVHVDVHIVVEDVSEKGLRFLSAAEFEPEGFIRFSLPSFGLHGLVEGRIVWKKALERNVNQYGLQIVSE